MEKRTFWGAVACPHRTSWGMTVEPRQKFDLDCGWLGSEKDVTGWRVIGVTIDDEYFKIPEILFRMPNPFTRLLGIDE
jgi:hypothetical protein